MKQHVKRHFNVLRSTLIGGVIFLLPLAVIGFLVGQIAPFAMSLFYAESENPHFDTPLGYAAAVFATLLALFALCLIAGLAAQASFSRALSEKFEKNLTMLFPRYAIFKDQLAGNLGGEYAADRLIPVFVPYFTGKRVGFEIERNDSLVTVYLPGSPDPWSGISVLFPYSEVERFDGPVGDILATFEKLGRDGLALLDAPPSESE